MAGWRDLGNIWTTFRQIDVRPIREEAEQPLVVAFVGSEGSGKSTLIAALRHDARANEQVISPTLEIGLDAAQNLSAADLVVLVLDATLQDHSDELSLYRSWKGHKFPVLVFCNKMDLVRPGDTLGETIAAFSDSRLAFGSANNPASLASDFVPRVLQTIPDKHLSLARHYPLFRSAVARDLIGETSAANATYSLGTGLAEVIPALDIPFNVADVVILTKNQALMVYKLGLVLGLSARWQDNVTQLGGVVGAGFLWRQVARQLVGLVPVWGIVPKVAVAYAGTYAVGEAVLYWYYTGHKLTGSGMRQLYSDALSRGRQVAQSLLARAPRPSLAPGGVPRLMPTNDKKPCPHCGRENQSDAKYCSYCGKPIAQ